MNRNIQRRKTVTISNYGGNTLVNTGSIGKNLMITGNERKEGVQLKSEDHNDDENQFRYDVAFSYASEQEKCVSRVAHILREDGVRVFYAPDQEDEFLGEDMIVRFYRIYRYDCKYVVAFISDDYLKKDFTMHEASTAMLRQKSEGRNCLIPVCFNGATLPKLNPDVSRIHADGLNAVEIADKILSILKNQYR